jgi:hypothetical protein
MAHFDDFCCSYSNQYAGTSLVREPCEVAMPAWSRIVAALPPPKLHTRTVFGKALTIERSTHNRAQTRLGLYKFIQIFGFNLECRVYLSRVWGTQSAAVVYIVGRECER